MRQARLVPDSGDFQPLVDLRDRAAGRRARRYFSVDVEEQRLPQGQVQRIVVERVDDGDGVQEILLAGVNNGRRSATLVVLDPRNFTGASDQGPSPYQIRGYPIGSEKAVVFFQRTCANRKLALYNMARMITPLGDRFRVAVFENLREGGDNEIVLYTMERTLEPVLVQVSDGFRLAHENHRTAGVLDHRLTEQEIQALRQVRIYRAGESPGRDAE